MNKILPTLVLVFTAAYLSAYGQAAKRFDVLITEIMADPSPVVGLPNAEYIEIRNNSFSSFNINGWKLGDANTTATISANYFLHPDSVVILCSHSNVNALSVHGKVIGISSFPSLDNDGEVISLRSNTGVSIHAVNYSAGWHSNSIKRDGGWSLEMIDRGNPCSGKTNWTSSRDIKGGTPGITNSVQASNLDSSPPQLVRTFSLDSLTIIAIFNEPLDSSMASVNSYFHLSPAIGIDSVQPLSPLFSSVKIKLAQPMQNGNVYTLSVTHVTDCANNSVGAYNQAKSGIEEEPMVADLIINEILFNPRPGAHDYVEIYNRSGKIVDASKIWLASGNNNGITAAKKLHETRLFIYPGEYIVITEDAAALQTNYFVNDPASILPLTALPSFPDDSGVVIISNIQGDIVDEVVYSEKWHFALIDNKEGVSLERLDPAGASQKPDNWHSASTTSGYGTPGYKNSQYLQMGQPNANIEIIPKIFSPDHDGHDDVSIIRYEVDKPGYIANIIIFDVNGKPVRNLVQNNLMGLKGSWKWDGLNDQQQQLPIGSYIVFIELFNLEGKRKLFKDVLVVARRQ